MNICKPSAGVLLCFALAFGCSSSARFTDRSGGAKPSAGRGTENTPARSNSSGKVLLTLDGIASYYADDFNGKQAANGELFDMNAMVAAHRTFPFGTKVRVTNLENKLQVIVRVIDRGPFKEGRIIDVSLGAAKLIDLVRTGTARVRLEVLEWGDGKLYH